MTSNVPVPNCGLQEQFWIESAIETGLSTPKDWGDADRYVYLGVETYAGLSVITEVAHSGITVDELTMIKNVLEKKIARGHIYYENLLGNEQWIDAAVRAIHKVSEWQAGAING